MFIYIYTQIYILYDYSPQSHQPSYTVSKAPAGVDAWHATLTMTSTSLASQNVAKSDGRSCSSSLGSVYNMFHLQWSSVKQPIFSWSQGLRPLQWPFLLGRGHFFFRFRFGLRALIHPPTSQRDTDGEPEMLGENQVILGLEIPSGNLT